jgi:porphobilinogen synthase
MAFPVHRSRRLRKTERLRAVVRETTVRVDDLIYPLFVRPGTGVKSEIGSMPGNFHFSIDRLLEECREIADLGIPAVILFGLPESKDPLGKDAYDPQGIVQRAIEALKREIPGLLVIADCCLCEYTSHGHCGRLAGVDVDNDATLELLSQAAVAQARAGADIIAPSDMMDGRVAAIRKALDASAFIDIPILSYAAKFASAFYGPFREAADSAPQFGDRRGYQMDPANQREAMREIAQDIDEGADIIMVKPALPYLDIVHRAKQEHLVPVAAYQVSGEYSMIVAAGRNGWIDADRIMWETLTSIKRAGADLILTYFAKKIAQELNGK